MLLLGLNLTFVFGWWWVLSCCYLVTLCLPTGLDVSNVRRLHALIKGLCSQQTHICA